ncbi:nuclear transport factor 2 family protein [Microbacterium wangruii]|uniref:nuclear transport factor 2 family protein n=1 Tax=Microbacterium wangruii TaxID=3049073 RepID=UPI00256F43A6|nr:nuclear transport factor 2 family protein [Microbacterium sp. zg-Y1211]MDL5487976.1 nuclear transport factor 2 family protein [Microbacterium sp. zg-Y1211]
MAGLVSGAPSDLDGRLRRIEDRLEIADLIARYGPAVDAGSGDAVAALWTVDGEYAFDDAVLTGPEIADVVDHPTHRRLMAAGCAHVLSPPRIDLDGDRATVVHHSIVLESIGGAWTPVRVSANRWLFVRTPGGWRACHRSNRLLTGSDEARALLAP